MYLLNGSDDKIVLDTQVWSMVAFKQVGCCMNKKGHRPCETMLKVKSPNGSSCIVWERKVHEWPSAKKIKLSLHHGELPHA